MVKISEEQLKEHVDYWCKRTPDILKICSYQENLEIYKRHVNKLDEIPELDYSYLDK